VKWQGLGKTVVEMAALRWVILVIGLSLSGCATVEYVHQAWEGHRTVMQTSVPVTTILTDPVADPQLQARLAQALKARRFASDRLQLPDNPSYTRYSALPRPYVVWNLFVAPEFSVDPVEHCFLFAGCTAYKGYFDEQRTRQEARTWREKGMDVYVGGVPAYSTLGWYDDPLLSSMLHWDDAYVAELIFHELAHQLLFVRDDTAFNESFATFVGQEGMRQWRAAQGLEPADASIERQRQQFIELVQMTTRDLRQLYASEVDDQARRQAKAARFEQLRAEYRYLQDQHWAGDTRYDAWIDAELNNASLLPFGLYDQWVPAFERLFRQAGNDWDDFYQAVRKVAALDPKARQAQLERLSGRPPAPRPTQASRLGKLLDSKSR